MIQKRQFEVHPEEGAENIYILQLNHLVITCLSGIGDKHYEKINLFGNDGSDTVRFVGMYKLQLLYCGYKQD